MCNKPGLKRLQIHLKNVHKLTAKERKTINKTSLPSADTVGASPSATWEEEEKINEGCEMREKPKEICISSGEKCHTVTHREQTHALKEVNKALRWFTKSLHCDDAPYARCNRCNEFKRHVHCMLQGITL